VGHRDEPPLNRKTTAADPTLHLQGIRYPVGHRDEPPLNKKMTAAVLLFPLHLLLAPIAQNSENTMAAVVPSLLHLLLAPIAQNSENIALRCRQASPSPDSNTVFRFPVRPLYQNTNTVCILLRLNPSMATRVWRLASPLGDPTPTTVQGLSLHQHQEDFLRVPP
jgi:hypothetical protein